MTWYQLNELQQNLRRVVTQEHHQLDCLDVATDVVTLSAGDVSDTVADLQVINIISIGIMSISFRAK